MHVNSFKIMLRSAVPLLLFLSTPYLLVSGTQQAVRSLRRVNYVVSPGSGISCTKHSASTIECPSLTAACAAARHLNNDVAVTISFAHHEVLSSPLTLESPPFPATLRLQGAGDGSAILDGGYQSGLLRIRGGGAVSVDSVIFRNGAVPYLKGSTIVDYAPVCVGFPHPLTQQTTFSNCHFVNSVGAYGGAVALHHGETLFENCTFVNSSAYGDGGPDIPHQHGGGGAIYNVGGHLTLRRSTFVNSTCSDPPSVTPGTYGGHNGGAVLSMKGHVVVEDCVFDGGVAGQAGALYLFLYASLIARNTVFRRNRAVSIANHSWASGTGGAIFMDRGFAIFENASFEYNTADLAGGALYVWNSHGNKDGVPLNVSIGAKSRFIGNTANTQWGGAIVNWHSSVSINQTSFDLNSAAQFAGALWNDAESSSNLTHSVFTVNNTVIRAGGKEGVAVWSNKKGLTRIMDHNILVVDTEQQGGKAKDWFVGSCVITGDGLDVVRKRAVEERDRRET